MHRRLGRLAGALLALSCVSLAQVERGAIVGRVTDSTGLAVPAAEVIVHNTGTNVSFQTKSDEAGGYIAPSLNPGNYEITVKMQGFRAETHRGILIEVGQRVRADFTLQPGQVSETIEVTAEAPLIQNETSALGTVIAQKTIAELPLNGRSFISLLTLSSGITPGTPGRLLGGRGTQVQRGSSAFSANGMRDTSNNFLIDGIDNNEMAVSTIMYFPSVDAIQEFKVQTSASDAEFGRNGGGTVNLSIKSGSNDLHGTVYEFLRNEKMDAKNFFDPATRKIPPLKRNQYGFSLGAPIIKNKLFIFGDYEAKRYVEAQTYVNTIATNAQRAGDFSGFNLIFDPLNVVGGLRAAFPDNKIPANRLSGPAKFYAGLLPQPNTSTRLNNFVFNPNKTTHGEQFDVKADQYFSNSDTLALRYSYSWFNLYQPVDLPGKAGGDGFRFSGNNYSPSHQVALTHTHLFSPTLVNTARLGFTRLTIDQVSLNYGENLTAQAGIPGVNLTDFSSGLMAVTIAGYASMGDSGFTPAKLFQNNYHLQENVAWNHSEHSVKFGVDVRRRYLNFFQVGSPRGSMPFGTEITRQLPTVANTGDAFASFMLGIPNSGSMDRFVTGPYGQRYTEFGVFVKDDWKIRPNVTLNIGLRYELMTPLIEKYNRMSNFDLATGKIIPAGTQGSPRGGVETDKNNWAPRVGFAWSPMGSNRISIHGGAGIFYNIEASAGGKRLSENPPFLVVPSFTNNLSAPTRTMEQGFPLSVVVDLNNPSGVSLKAWQRDFRNGYVVQSNLTIETEIMKNLVVRNMYVANSGVHLFAAGGANQPRPGPGDAGPRRPYPLIQGIGYFASRGHSTHHSWQLQVERRFARGLSFLSALTIGKTIDDNSGAFNDNDSGGGARTEDNLNYRLDKALSDFHVGKRFVNSFVWELPFGKGMRFGSSWSGPVNHILGGWQLNGVLSLQDGNPFNPSVADQTGQAGGERPNRIANGNLPASERSITRWFDKAAFPLQPQFTYGTAGRNILFTPGQKNFDFSTFKNFRLTEKYNLQFRAEFFNFTNTPYFGAPNRRADLPAGGVISTARNPRNTQLGLKIVF